MSIWGKLMDLVGSGKGVIFYSTDYAELIGCCDRVAILYGGEIVRELEGDDLTERQILTAALNLRVKETIVEEAAG